MRTSVVCIVILLRGGGRGGGASGGRGDDGGWGDRVWGLLRGSSLEVRLLLELSDDKLLSDEDSGVWFTIVPLRRGSGGGGPGWDVSVSEWASSKGSFPSDDGIGESNELGGGFVTWSGGKDWRGRREYGGSGGGCAGRPPMCIWEGGRTWGFGGDATGGGVAFLDKNHWSMSGHKSGEQSAKNYEGRLPL